MGIGAAEKLIKYDNVYGIIGPTCSSVALSVAPITEANKIVFITPIASTPDLTYAGDYVFRTKVSGSLQGNKLAEFAFNELGYRNASIIYINSDNGVGYKDSFSKRFGELGGKVLGSESYERGGTDFRSQLLKVKKENPDFLFLAGQAYENGVRQAAELGLDIQIIGPAMERPELIEIAGDAAEGVLYSYSAFDSDDSYEVTVEYQRNYKERYGRLSEMHAANAYDSLVFMAKAIEECDRDSDCIRDYLYDIKDYEGVSGIITFDEYGDVVKPLIIKTVKNGEFVEVD